MGCLMRETPQAKHPLPRLEWNETLKFQLQQNFAANGGPGTRHEAGITHGPGACYVPRISILLRFAKSRIYLT